MAHSYVILKWHGSFISEFLCDMTPPCVNSSVRWRIQTWIRMWHGSFICEFSNDMAHSYLNSQMTWLVHKWILMWYDSFMCELVCDMAHSYVNSYVPWLITQVICKFLHDMAHLYDTRPTNNISTCWGSALLLLVLLCSQSYVTHSCVNSYVTGFIHVWILTWHGSFMCEFLCDMTPSCVNLSCHQYEWVMSHTWMSHVTHMNESCHT